VRIWDVATGQQRASLTGHTGTVNAASLAGEPHRSSLVARRINVNIGQVKRYPIQGRRPSRIDCDLDDEEPADEDVFEAEDVALSPFSGG
jgi:hypothetical protein